MKRLHVALRALVFLAAGTFAHAQFIEDGVRLSRPNGIITARAGALGPAYSGVADDFAALYYNPAGLMLVPKRELTMGLQLYHNENSTNYGAFPTTLDGNSEAINTFGFVSPLKFGSTKAAIAVGYTLESDFDDDYKIVGNGRSSIVSAWTNSPTSGALAYDLYLADSIGGQLVTPVTGGLEQTATVIENGGLHALAGGLSFDIADNVALGFALHGKWGNYSYDRRYREVDVNNIYNTLDTVNFSTVDLASVSVRETVDQDISGIGATIGVLGRLGEHMRFGISIKTPSYYSITETFSRTATAEFDKGDSYSSPADGPDEGRNSYSVTTPFVFNTGMSFHMAGLTVAGAVEYSDLSQVEFSSTLIEIEDLNIDIAEQLTNQFVWSLGAEFEAPALPVVFRAGLSNGSSYYQADDDAKFSTYSLGAGLYFAPNIRVDAMYRYRETSYTRALYNSSDAVFTVDNQSSQFALQFIYRF